MEKLLCDKKDLVRYSLLQLFEVVEVKNRQ